MGAVRESDVGGVHFLFADERFLPLPADPEEFQAWHRRVADAGALLGPASWTVQTFVQLRRRGFPCTLVTRPPPEGVVVAHWDHVPDELVPGAARYWVCLQADRPVPCAAAQFHVVQNPRQRLRFGRPTAYMPHWPQPGLVPRPDREPATPRRLRFFGEGYSLAEPLRGEDFSRWCTEHGFDFRVVPRDAWHDFSEVDIVLALRRFDPQVWFHDKPATKLFNGWLGRVPTLAGRESAFRHEGRVGVDYLEAGDIDSLKAQLLRLRDEPALARSLVAAGDAAAQRCLPEALADRWVRLMDERVLPAAARWRASSGARMAWERFTTRLLQGLAWRGHLLKATDPRS